MLESCTRLGKNRKINELYNKFRVMKGIDDVLSLSSEQTEMLLMSEKDIENGNLISESELNDSDSKWLN